MAQLLAGTQGLAGEEVEPVSRHGKRTKGAAELAEDLRGERADVVVGQVQVPEVLQLGEGPRHVIETIALQVHQLQVLFHSLRAKKRIRNFIFPSVVSCSKKS